MLAIKLSRMGKKNQPFFRIIVLEKTKDPFGDYLELLGNYNPKTKEINLKNERIKYWLSQGAQPTVTVHNLFVKQGVIEGDKQKAVKITKKRTEKQKAAEQEKAAASESVAAEADDKQEAVPAESQEEKKTEEKPESKEESATEKEEPKADQEVEPKAENKS